MRYRSATVAGFHGLPCFPGWAKNNEPPHATAGAGTAQDQSSLARINEF